MNIELAQVFTQIIAFLLFLWVLRKFAWGPVMAMLEERRSRIKAEFDKIDNLEKEVNDLKEKYQTKIDEIEKEARELRLQEIKRGKEICDKMQEDAKHMISQEREQLEQQLAVEMAKAKVELRDFIVDLTINASSKLLHQSMDDETHRHLVDEYVRQVTEIQN